MASQLRWTSKSVDLLDSLGSVLASFQVWKLGVGAYYAGKSSNLKAAEAMAASVSEG
jgi:hypothetical protein